MSGLETTLAEVVLLEVEACGLLENGAKVLDHERTEVEEALRRLREARREAERFGAHEADSDGDIRSRAGAADRQLRTIKAHADALRGACKRLSLSIQQSRERDRLGAEGQAAAHCFACGKPLHEQNFYCANCGAPVPLDEQEAANGTI